MGRHALLLLIVGSLLPGRKAVAQTTPEDSRPPEPRVIVHHSLIDWLHPLFPGAHLGVDYRIGRGDYLRHEAGYLFDLGYNDPAALRRLSGLRFRTAYRRYFTSSAWRRLTYLEFGLSYRYLDADLAGDFRRGGSSFRQRIDYSLRERSAMLQFRGGVCLPIGRHWLIDLGVGAGVRMSRRRYSEVPGDAEFVTNGSLLIWDYGADEGRSFGYQLPLVLGVGYQW